VLLLLLGGELVELLLLVGEPVVGAPGEVVGLEVLDGRELELLGEGVDLVEVGGGGDQGRVLHHLRVL